MAFIRDVVGICPRDMCVIIVGKMNLFVVSFLV